MRKLKGQKGAMAIKIDLEKAYNRLDWNFLRRVLMEIGFPSKLIGLIMNIVTTVQFALLWNGERTDSFFPSRGLRQGDRLSPYLFVLCLDKLSHMIKKAVVEQRWRPFMITREGPP